MEAKVQTKGQTKVVPTAVDVQQRDAKLTQLANARAAKVEKHGGKTKAKVSNPLFKVFSKGVAKGLGFGVAGFTVVIGMALGIATIQKVLGIKTFRIEE